MTQEESRLVATEAAQTEIRTRTTDALIVAPRRAAAFEVGGRSRRPLRAAGTAHCSTHAAAQAAGCRRAEATLRARSEALRSAVMLSESETARCRIAGYFDERYRRAVKAARAAQDAHDAARRTLAQRLAEQSAPTLEGLT